VKITVFYVGTSLLAPLRRAESEINARYRLGLQVAAYNCGAPLGMPDWQTAERDLASSDVVFVIHVTEGENAARILAALDHYRARHHAVVAFNCMPDLMRCVRMGKLDFSRLMKSATARQAQQGGEASAPSMVRRLGMWMADFVKTRSTSGGGPAKSDQYVKLIGRLPAMLKFVPGAGRLGDIKNYLLLFCYFLQPTPNNIRSMLLHTIKHYLPGDYRAIKIETPEAMPVVAVYHPDAPKLFETFEAYRKWYERKHSRALDPAETIGLLLMRPQIVSDARSHYDGLIRAIEGEGLSVIPAISTFMDNRDACRQFFVEGADDVARAPRTRAAQHPRSSAEKPRVSQIVSLTGFSFVGGPAMNDSQAAAEFLGDLNVPFRSMVSLDVQTIESWRQSKLGLNPIQTAMQVAIPEIDGSTEPFVYGGLPENGNQPEPLEEFARRGIHERTADDLLPADGLDQFALAERREDAAAARDAADVGDLRRRDRLLVGDDGQRLERLQRQLLRRTLVEQLANPLIQVGPGDNLKAARNLDDLQPARTLVVGSQRGERGIHVLFGFAFKQLVEILRRQRLG